MRKYIWALLREKSIFFACKNQGPRPAYASKQSFTACALIYDMSHDMWFPTMWHFDKCRLGLACTASFYKLRNSEWCLVSSLTVIQHSSDKQRLWSDCAYVQADLRLCWSHTPHCWKSHVVAHIIVRFMINVNTVQLQGHHPLQITYSTMQNLNNLIASLCSWAGCFEHDPVANP